MKHRWILASWLVAGCTGGGDGAPLSSLELGSPVPPPRLVREAAEGPAGGADLHVPGSVRWVDGAVWVLDGGNDRLVRFDSALARASAYGREGEGPGELQFASSMASAGGLLIVAETGNGRLSVFDREGTFRRTIPSTTVPLEVAAPGGEPIVAPGVEGFYAARPGGAGHARIPEGLVALARSDPATYPPANGFIGASGEVLYVLDPSVLAVAAYDRDGTLRDARLLPEPHRTGLLEARREELASWGARADAFLSVPATKRLSVDDRGRLLVPFVLPEHWALLIDPSDWSARPIPFPESELARQILRSASEAVLHGSRLFVISDDRLYLFDARGWP